MHLKAKMSTNASNKKSAGPIKVQIDLPALHPTKFYASIKKKRCPKRKPLSEALQKVSHHKPVHNPYTSYTVSYKLQVLSYWYTASIPYGPTKLREPCRQEVASYFRILVSNLARWQKEEKEGKYSGQTREQRRAAGGG